VPHGWDFDKEIVWIFIVHLVITARLPPARKRTGKSVAACHLSSHGFEVFSLFSIDDSKMAEDVVT
jgi:hypothetical protein